MSHGVPVVCSTVAQEGMHLVDGKDALIADDPALFAQKARRTQKWRVELPKGMLLPRWRSLPHLYITLVFCSYHVPLPLLSGAGGIHL